MGRLRTYECSDCGGRFEEYHHAPDEPPPPFCKLCGASTVAPDTTLRFPHLATGRGKAVDDVYRAMEEGADFRARKAADMGASSAEAAGLRITNMRDGLREGDTANIPVENVVTRAMSAVPPSMVGNVSADQAMQYSGAVMNGPAPNAGARSIRALRSLHNTMERQPVYDNPALETKNPNYQRRV